MKKLIFSTIFLFALSLNFTSCRDTKKAEDVQDAVEQTVEDAGDAAETLGDAVDEAIDEAGDALDDAADAVDEAIDDAANATRDKIKEATNN